MTQDELQEEIQKVRDNPYYFATKYLTLNGKSFTTHLNEVDFNNVFQTRQYLKEWAETKREEKVTTIYTSVEGAKLFQEAMDEHLKKK